MAPWAGWAGLQTVGPTVAAGSAGLVVTAILRADRRLALLALLGAVVAVALIAWRLASPPEDPLLRSVRSPASLLLAAAGAVVVGYAAVRVAQADSMQRRSLGDREAWAVAWRGLWASRLLVWVAGVLAVLKVGVEPVTPPGVTQPFGQLGNLLTAPASTWDAGSYLMIAQFGYAGGDSLQAFLPLYPGLLRLGAWSPEATLLTAIVLSIGALLVALYLTHRLVTLERGRGTADLAVALIAFSPMAVFLSAAYTESLFLALSVGAFYAARRGWWARAGIAGGLAAACRVPGFLVMVPLLVLYLRGPRADRPQGGRLAIDRDAAWLLLVPAGALAYLVYSGAHGDFLAPFHAAQTYWNRDTVPLLGAIHGLGDGFQSLRQIAGAQALEAPTAEFAGQLADPLKLAAANLTDLAFLGFACVATVGALRTLPAAYGVYCAVSILVVVSTFPPHEPLQSVPRYVLVLFPCQIWLAIWAKTPGRQQVVVALSAGLLAIFAAQFATWRWVA